MGYSYDGSWASMDTFKDKQYLESLYGGGGVPCEVWNVNGNREELREVVCAL